MVNAPTTSSNAPMGKTVLQGNVTRFQENVSPSPSLAKTEASARSATAIPKPANAPLVKSIATTMTPAPQISVRPQMVAHTLQYSALLVVDVRQTSTATTKIHARSAPAISRANIQHASRQRPIAPTVRTAPSTPVTHSLKVDASTQG